MYIDNSLRTPIAKIASELADKITEQTGIDSKLVEDTLFRLYPRGSVGAFMTEYFEIEKALQKAYTAPMRRLHVRIHVRLMFVHVMLESVDFVVDLQLII